ncbi:Sec-independent protein translocase protein TatB [Niveibacterium sp. 24ML]|uniref:Sec-independent protein translocase protein TatB n=1 Tax=Niveibacterium sp. 24ML TaxID=2985512 RepID=UPI00226FDCBB|nr:Sec-independent protein translocase protein TatB [Niveibacterium sp. 24ML]MCX9154868.1 Sec-independent protein translocase protein TatB [Niveibacterium sp. 24ML]
MFDVGFTELMVIGLVALVVIGPEKLPRVARTIGHLLGRMQRHVAEVKADISREIQLDEMKRLQSQVVDSAREIENSIRDQAREFEDAMKPIAHEVETLATPAAQAVAAPALEQLVELQPTAPTDPSAPPQAEPAGPDRADDTQLDLFGQPMPSQQTVR